LLVHEDADIAEEVAKMLREDGIEVLLGTAAVRAESAGGDSTS
jgi:NADPH-dependent 2,4-dienoyl-CoA reductase/sulfur reductase-like enzyme